MGWLALGAAALAAEVTLSAGLEDLTSQAARFDSAGAGADLRLAPGVAVGVHGGFALGPARPDELTQILSDVSGTDWPYRSSRAHGELLLDLGFGPPEDGDWAGGPHLVVGPAVHLRQDVLPGDALGVSRLAGGVVVGGAFDAWYRGLGARLSVIDHVLVETELWSDTSVRRPRSNVAFGLDLRARI